MEIRIAASYHNTETEKIIKKITAFLKKNKLKAKIIKTTSSGLYFSEPAIKILSSDTKPKIYTNISAENIDSYLQDYFSKKFKLANKGILKNKIITKEAVILKKFASLIPDSIEDYIAHKGYETVIKLLKKSSPADISNAIKESELRRRNYKNDNVGILLSKFYSLSSEEKFLICNAFDYDPSSQNQKTIILSNIHSIIEGMIISAYATNTRIGYIFIDVNDDISEQMIKTAIYDAKSKGFLGGNILGTNFNFNIKIKKGFHSLLFGMDKAIVLAMEGKRFSPDFSNDNFITLSAETFASIPWIMKNKPANFKKTGIKNNFGTKLVTLSGKIKNPQVAEVNLGISIKNLVEEYGGGIKSDKKLKAVQLGGINGIFLNSDLTNITFDFDSLKKLYQNINLDSVVVFDESSCMVDVTWHTMEVLSNESCGKCTICRIGLKRITEILKSITKGNAGIDDLRKLKALGEELQNLSLCDFGKSAATPLLSSLKYFRDEFVSHIENKRCPAKKCPELIKYKIISKNCTACGLCKEICPVDAISVKNNIYSISSEKCIKCNACFEVCSDKAISIVQNK